MTEDAAARWKARWEAAIEDAQAQRDRVAELESLLDETQDTLMSVDPELQRLADENDRLRTELDRYADIAVSDRTHYCMPYCGENCDIQTVRVYHKEEVIERRDVAALLTWSDDMNARLEWIRQHGREKYLEACKNGRKDFRE